MDTQTLDMIKLVLVGAIVLTAFLYRRKTWKSSGFYLSLRMNVFVFVSFGIGCVIAISSGVINSSANLSHFYKTFWLFPPLAYYAYRFMTGSYIEWFDIRVVIGTVAWVVVVMAALGGSGGSLLLGSVLAVSAISAGLVLGVVNGALGPLLPGLAIANYAGAWLLSDSAGAMPLKDVVELAAEFLPAALRNIVGGLLIFAGLADALSFYGLRSLIERYLD